MGMCVYVAAVETCLDQSESGNHREKNCYHPIINFIVCFIDFQIISARF